MANNRVGYDDSLNLTTSLCLSYTLIVAILRGWIRRSNYGVDDWIIAAAVLVCLGHFASNYAALHYGSGTRWTYIQQNNDAESLNSVRFLTVG